jgi:hypothetical protein
VQLGYAPDGLVAQANGKNATALTLDQLLEWGGLAPGQKVTKGEGLFPRKDVPAKA